jgi:hypothetical protein
MKLAIIALLLFYIGCQDFNSNTFDKDRYGEIELAGNVTPSFRASYKILQTKCMNCHRHAQWAGYTNSQDWVTNENLITPGASTDGGDSQLIRRIINYGATESDMPQGGSALPASDFETLKAWEAEYL